MTYLKHGVQVMKILMLIPVFLSNLLASFAVTAFETETHAAMTAEAVARSKLTRDPKVSPLFKQLGLAPTDEPIGRRYIDMGVQTISRGRDDFEKGIMKETRDQRPDLSLPADYSLTGWFMRGAIREDDNGLEVPNSDEPGGVFSRVYGHFYDPQNDRGLTFFGNRGARSVDWALTPGATANGRENHFKVTDAREAMWRALTLKRFDAGTLVDVPLTSALVAIDPPAKSKVYERQAYWATTFRALGDVVHLLQDSAQPQHTRNDSHSGYGCLSPSNPDATCLAGHDSFFERYIKARTVGEPTFALLEGFLPPSAGDPLPTGIPRPIAIRPINFADTSYALPRFSKYSDYFATGVGVDNATGKGLANYSNRGFYTFGTNINSPSLPSLPSPPQFGFGLGLETLAAAQTENMVGVKLNAKLEFRTGAVQDNLTGVSEPNVRLSTLSVWDQFLSQRDGAFRYSLNYYNYDEQARLLIPRAIAYSAGLIDYFFRGELKTFTSSDGVYAIVDHADAASNCKDNCGFKKLKILVANSTPDIAVSGGGGTIQQGMTGGMLVAVAKYKTNSCYTTDLEGEYDSLKNTEGGIAYYARCVSADELISVSDPKTVTSVPRCDSAIANDCKNNAQQYVFDFATPIPINATDLYLQIVYRGKLGDEDDAVVVETIDITEPTYVSLVNVTDYLVCYQQKWYFKTPTGGLPSAIPTEFAYQLVASTHTNYKINFGSTDATNRTVVSSTVAPNEFTRVAVLTNTSGWTIDDKPRGVAAMQKDYNPSGTANYTVSDVKNPLRRVRTNVVFYYPPFVYPPFVGSCPPGEDGPAAQPGFPPYSLPTIKPATINFSTQ
jgi:hypothetical protein